MIVESIKIELEKYRNKSDVIKIGYIKEYLQTLILKEIYEFPDCKDILFYGGTASRFLFGLNRLSEDLDFVTDEFSKFEELGQFLQNKLKNYGLNIEFKIQKFRLTLKFRNLLEDFGLKYLNFNDLYIKIEISDNFEFLKNYEVKIYPIFKFNQSLIIKSFDESTLFSTKINAILYRKWEKKGKNVDISVKGRDFYDLFWYLQRGTKPNLDCINGVKNFDELKEKLTKIVENTDFDDVEADIKNFVEDQNMVEFIKMNGKDYILEQVGKW